MKVPKPLLDLLLFLCCLWAGLLAYAFWPSPVHWDISWKQPGLRRFILGDSLEQVWLAEQQGDSSLAELSSLEAEARLQELLNEEEQAQGLRPDASVARESLNVADLPSPAYLEVPKDGRQDTSSKYLLLAGDSMTEELRFAFQEYARFNGHKLITCIWYSSNTQIWSETKRLQTLIEDYRPSLIFFTLGGNELFIRNIQQREPYVRDIIRQADAQSIPMVWIGPPNWKEDTGLNDLILKNIGPSRYYPSKNLKLARKRDGAHPTREASAIWADSIVQWFNTASAYRFDCWLRNPKGAPKEAYRPYQASRLDSSLQGRLLSKAVRILQAKELPLSQQAVLASAASAANPAKDSPPKPPARPAKDSSPKLPLSPARDSLPKTNSPAAIEPKPQPLDSPRQN